MSTTNGLEDLIDGRVRRQRTIQYGELAFQSLGNIVSPTARVNHGGNELNVSNGSEVTRLLETVETLELHDLSYDLVCDLVIDSKNILLKKVI